MVSSVLKVKKEDDQQKGFEEKKEDNQQKGVEDQTNYEQAY